MHEIMGVTDTSRRGTTGTAGGGCWGVGGGKGATTAWGGGGSPVLTYSPARVDAQRVQHHDEGGQAAEGWLILDNAHAQAWTPARPLESAAQRTSSQPSAQDATADTPAAPTHIRTWHLCRASSHTCCNCENRRGCAGRNRSGSQRGFMHGGGRGEARHRDPSHTHTHTCTHAHMHTH